MENRSLDIISVEDTRVKVSDVKIIGNPDVWELVCKASSDAQGWMRSTKRMNVERGSLYQVSTQQRNPDGSYAVAEALAFVPDSSVESVNSILGH